MDQSDPQNPEDEAALLQHGFRYALALTHRHEEAEDLVQEAWLNLCRRYGRVETRAVLLTTVRNLFIDQCRRKKIVVFESLDQLEPTVLAGVAAEEPGLKGDLDALLGTLRPAERELLFLHYHDGRTAEEISQLLGQPRGTVLSSIHRSIAKLREAVRSGANQAPVCNQTLLLFVLFMIHSHSR